MKLKIVADEALQGLEMLKEHDLRLFSGREIKARDLKDADALLVRSVTRVNEALIADAFHLSFVGTATIGVDHIDSAALAKRGIKFSYAPGCNANAVVDYVLAVLLGHYPDKALSGMTVGVAGYGNVGRRLVKALAALEIKFVVYDPLLDQSLVPNACSEAQLFACEAISLHVPLTRQGMHATQHWFSTSVLKQLGALSCLINSSRGDVIEQSALLDFLEHKKHSKFVLALDVWPNEPQLEERLFTQCEVATPHIAGHSLAGKLRGSFMVFDAMAEHFGISLPEPEANIEQFSFPFDLRIESDANDQSGRDALRESLNDMLALKTLSNDFKTALLNTSPEKNVEFAFEAFRKAYNPRKEFSYS